MGFTVNQSKDGFKVSTIDKDGKEYVLGCLEKQGDEIKKFIASFDEFTDRDIYIIFGVSFTEHIRELIKVNKSFKRILVVELNKEFFDFIKEEGELNYLQFDKRIHFATDKNMIKSFFDNFINDFNIANVKIGYYANVDKAYIKELSEIAVLVNDLSYKIINNRNTNLMFSSEWLDTLLSNLVYMKDSTPINVYKDKYKDIPAIIVSAGPSLSKNIKKLRNVDNAIIISGGRNLNTLLENGVKPNFLASVDSTDISHKHVEDNIENIDIPLLYYNATNKDIVKKHTSNKIFYTDNEFIRDIFEIDIPHLGGGGSVAHFSTNFALYAGCNPIIFVGQDLAYTDEKGHDDNSLNKNSNDNIPMVRSDDIEVDDIYGGKIKTSIVLDGFRKELEEIIATNNIVSFINSTEGGAMILGTEIKELEKTIKDLEKISVDLDIKDEFVEASVLIENLVDYKSLLVNINNKCRNGVTIIDKIEKSIGKPKAFSASVKNLENTERYIKSNLDNLSIIKNKMFEIMYTASNSDKYKVKSTDTKVEYIKKNFRKNKDIYIEFSKVLTMTNKEINKILAEWKKV